MLKPVEMLKLHAIILSRDKRVVLQELGRMGALHIALQRKSANAADFSKTGISISLAPLAEKAAEIYELMGLAAGRANPAEISIEGIEKFLKVSEEKYRAILEAAEKLRERKNQLTAVIEQLRSFESVDLPFEKLDEFSFLHFAIGSIPAAKIEELRDALAAGVVLIELPRNNGRTGVVAASSRIGRFAMEAALEGADFKEEKIETSGKPLEEVLAKALEEDAKVAAEIEKCEKRRFEMVAETAPNLDAIAVRLANEIRLQEAEDSLDKTAMTVTISGWIPAMRREEVCEGIRKLTSGNCEIETISPEEIGEEPPVLLRHNALLRPFEMLVAGYGLPGYHELEPTIFVAISYMLMFGMMFGDVGHGAILALGGLYALFRGKMQKVRDVGTLLVLAGVSSAIFGVVYGSYFGIEAMHKYALWHDPLDGNPLQLMLAAMGLGVAVISVGVILNIINRFRRRDWVGGFLDGFGVAGALFYWGVLGLLLKFASLKERGLTGLAIALAVALPIVLWALREPIKLALRRKSGVESEEGESYLQAGMEGIVEAFESVLSYMANTISFVRLAAYAMSHAAVLMATFVMAREVQRMSGNSVGSVIVIIIGNCIAIALEGIIAAVQALRLEYYEFFGKFFAAKGEAFEPFTLEK